MYNLYTIIYSLILLAGGYVPYPPNCCYPDAFFRFLLFVSEKVLAVR